MKRLINILALIVLFTCQLNAQTQFDYMKQKYDSLMSINNKQEALKITKQMNQWALENEGDTSINYAVSFKYLGNCLDDKDSALLYYNISKKTLENQNRKNVVEYGDCLNNIGLIYANINDTANAINNYQSALLIYDNSIGRNNFNYLKTLSNIALLYFNIQNYNEAERYYKIIEQIFVNNRLENNEKNIVNNIRLGDVYFNLLNYEESAKYLFKATDYLEKVYPKYENDYYLVLRKIGQLFQAQNDYNNAEYYFEKSYQICKNRSASVEIDNGWCLYYLAYSYQLNNKYLASEKCFLESYSIVNKGRLSKQEELAFLYDIANFYFVSGDTIKSFNYLATADSIYIADNNVYSSDYADCQYQKGCYYVFVNKIDSAELLFENSIAIRKFIFKNNFDEVNISLKKIAELYLKYHRADPSEKYFNQIKKNILEYNDLKSLFYARSLNEIGLQYYTNEFYQLAELYFLECYKILVEENITEKNDIIIITNNLALLYLYKGDYNNAKEYFIKYYNLLLNSEDQDITKKVECLINLGLVNQKLKDYNSARSYYKEGIKISSKNSVVQFDLFRKLINNYCILLNDFNDFKIQLQDFNYLLKVCELSGREKLMTRIYSELGGFYMDNREYEIAEKYYNATLNSENFNNEFESIDVVYSNIGLLYYKKKELNKSLHYYNIAIKKINELYGKASIKYAKALVDIGNVYYKISDYRNTDSLYTEAIEIEKVFYGLNDTNRLGLLDKAAHFYYVTNYNNKKGLDYYKEYLDLSSRKSCKTESLLIEAWYNMAELYSVEKDTINALTFYQKATKAQEVLKGEFSYEVGRLLYATGFMFYSNQSSVNAKHYFNLAKKILEKRNNSYSLIDNLYYNLGLIYQKEEALDSSIFYYTKVLRTKDTELKASVYNNLGLVYYRILKYKDALNYFTKSAQIAEQTRSYDLMANPILNKSIVYQNINDSAKYFHTMTDLMNILYKTDNYLMLAVAYMNIGRYYVDLGIKDSVYPYYKKSDSLYRTHSIIANDNYALLLNNLSIYYESRNDIDSAFYFNQKSLDMFRSLNLINYNYVLALNQTAILYETLGNIKKADEYYNTAIEINERLFHKITIEYLATYNNYGAYLISNNNYSEAISIYLYIKEQIEEKNVESGLLYSLTLNNLGTCYVMQSTIDSALFYFRLAEENIFKYKQFDLLPMVYSGSLLAGVFSHDSILVEKYFNLADSVYTKQIDQLANYALLLSNYSAFLIDNNKLQKAKYYLNIADSLRIRSNLNPQQIAILYAWYYYKSKEYSELIQVYNDWFKQKSEKIFNRFTTLSYREKRVFWNKEIREFFSILNLMKHDDYQELAIPMFNASIFIKSFLVDDNNSLNNSINSNNDTIINAIKRSKSLLLGQLENTLKTGNNSLIIRNLKSDIDSCDKILIQNSTDFKRLKQRISIRWNDIQNILNTNEAAIEFSKYYDSKDSCYKYMAQVLRPNYEYPLIVKLGLEKEIEKYTAGNGLSELYHLVWEPIDSLLQGVETVYYSPDGMLYSVPFHALCMNDSAGCTYLMDKYTLHQLSTTRYLADSTLINTKPLNNTIALYGGINYDAVNDTNSTNHEVSNEDFILANNLKRETTFSAVSYLPGTKQEVESVVPLFNKNKWNTTIATGSQASEQLFKSYSDTLAPSIIHIATHGFAFPDKEESKKKNRMDMLMLTNNQQQYTAAEDPMMRCGLMFAGANKSWTGKQKEMIEQTGQDGILTAAEVANMDLSNTKLVVLSACETGLGKVEGSEGVFGLQRGFKLAGVEQLIVSLWKVPDRETMELMNLFYTDLTITKDPVISFSKAQKQMRNNYPDNPEKWAGFVLVR